MVHALRSPTHAARMHPDARRIAGLALAIGINAGLLMVLLVPMRFAPPLALPEALPPIQWIQAKPEIPPTPPRVPVVRHRETTHPAIPKHVPATVEPGPAMVDHAESTILVAADDPPADPRPASGDADPAVPGVTLEYAEAPAPAYPRDALRDGVEGIVMLQVLVDIDGRPLRVDVQRSSGDRRLDNAARKQVLQHWRFRAAMKEGRAVQAIGLVPIAFRLQ
jgi:protein TonB